MKNQNYDVIVVGSGLGGLVCANYLSLGGLKVLVVEKNAEPGGYCTSFQRRGFTIDTVIHAIQNCQEGSVLNKIFTELDIQRELNLLRSNPTDTIILSSDSKINVYQDLNETISSFCHVFPHEKDGIIKFFNVLSKENFIQIYFQYKNSNFKAVLNAFFQSERIKAVFEIFLGNIGSFSSNTSAIAAFALLRQFILNGGYYPKGGMQRIPNLLVQRLREMGGELMTKNEVIEITIQGNVAKGIKLKTGESLSSDVTVVNSDLTYAFARMIQPNKSYQEFIELLEKAAPSYSIFIVYLLLRKQLKDSLDTGPAIWFVPNEECIQENYDFEIESRKRGFFCSVSSKLDNSLMPQGHDILRIMTSAKFHSQDYWIKNSSLLAKELIAKASTFIPKLDSYIDCVGRATPLTMRNYTLNYCGAVCGWMNSTNQINNPVVKNLPLVKNLYFTGHWITEKYGNGGVAMAAASGRRIAKSIVKKLDQVK